MSAPALWEWNPRTLARWTLGALCALTLGGAVGYRIGHKPVQNNTQYKPIDPSAAVLFREDPRGPGPGAATLSELVVLAPLRPGYAWGPCVITRMDRLDAGLIRVELTYNTQPVTLTIARKGGAPAPAEAHGFAIYYQGRGNEAGLAAQEVAKVLASQPAKPLPAELRTLTP